MERGWNGTDRTGCGWNDWKKNKQGTNNKAPVLEQNKTISKKVRTCTALLPSFLYLLVF